MTQGLVERMAQAIYEEKCFSPLLIGQGRSEWMGMDCDARLHRVAIKLAKSALQALTPTGEAGEMVEWLTKGPSVMHLKPFHPVRQEAAKKLEAANLILSLQAQLAARDAERAEAVGLLETMLPDNACVTNPNVPDDLNVPLNAPYGDLRAIDAFLTRIKQGGERGART